MESADVHAEAQLDNEYQGLAARNFQENEGLKKEVVVFEEHKIPLFESVLSVMSLFIGAGIGGLVLAPVIGKVTGFVNYWITFPLGIIYYGVAEGFFSYMVGRNGAYFRKSYLNLKIALMVHGKPSVAISKIARDITDAAKIQARKSIYFFIAGLLFVVACCVAREYLADKAHTMGGIFILIFLLLNPILFSITAYLNIGADLRRRYHKIKRLIKKNEKARISNQAKADQHAHILVDMVAKAEAQSVPITQTEEIRFALARYRDTKKADLHYYYSIEKYVEIVVKDGQHPAPNIAITSYFENLSCIHCLTDENGFVKIGWRGSEEYVKRILIAGQTLGSSVFRAGSHITVDLRNLGTGTEGVALN